jgi:hypothetical protein
MKFIFILLSYTICLTTFAGAYDYECTSAKGNLTMSKSGGLVLSGVQREYISQDEPYWSEEEFVVDRSSALDLSAVSKRNIVKKNMYKDSCKNIGTRMQYTQVVRLKSLATGALVGTYKVFCKYRFISGHCE